MRAEGTDEDIVPARVFSGNRPTTSILAASLTPSVLGQLIALYEHITFVQGVVWGIDSFDQWGVELGKKLALEIAPAVQGDAAALDAQDPSTQALIGTTWSCATDRVHWLDDEPGRRPHASGRRSPPSDDVVLLARARRRVVAGGAQLGP